MTQHIVATIIILAGITAIVHGIADKNARETLERGALTAIGAFGVVVGLLLWKHGGGA